MKTIALKFGGTSMADANQIVNMFLGGTNFYLHFKAIYRRNSKGYARNEEFRFMLLLNMIFIALAFFIVS